MSSAPQITTLMSAIDIVHHLEGDARPIRIDAGVVACIERAADVCQVFADLLLADSCNQEGDGDECLNPRVRAALLNGIRLAMYDIERGIETVSKQRIFESGGAA